MMREYIISVLCVAVLSAVVCVLSPEEKGINRYVSFICALAVAVSLIYPLLNGSTAADITELTGGAYEIGNSTDGEKKDDVRFKANTAARIISALYGTDVNRMSAKAVTDNNGNITEIRIITGEIPLADTEDLSYQLSDMLDIPVKVIAKDEIG